MSYVFQSGLIRARREDLGLTQKQFAERIGMNPQYLYYIESGKQRIPPKWVKAICKHFRVITRLDLEEAFIDDARAKWRKETQ